MDERALQAIIRSLWAANLRLHRCLARLHQDLAIPRRGGPLARLSPLGLRVGESIVAALLDPLMAKAGHYARVLADLEKPRHERTLIGPRVSPTYLALSTHAGGGLSLATARGHAAWLQLAERLAAVADTFVTVLGDPPMTPWRIERAYQAVLSQVGILDPMFVDGFSRGWADIAALVRRQQVA